MTHNPLASREKVVVPPRPAPGKAMKRRVWEREGGICWWCQQAVPQSGPLVEYDHKLARELMGEGADEEANLYPMHKRPCHLDKSKGEDWPRIFKARRQAKLTAPKVASKNPIRSGAKLPGKGKGPKLRGGGFAKGPKQKINSRGFR